MSIAAMKRRLKKVPVIGPVLKTAWRSLGVPIKDAYLRSIPETERQTVYFGRSFFYPSRSIIGRFVAGGDEWDGVVLRQIMPMLPKDAQVVEVGSNIGASTLVMAKLLPRAKFLLIEAAERYRHYLTKNIAHLDARLDGRAVSDGSSTSVVMQTNSTTGTPSNVDYHQDVTSSAVVKTAMLGEVMSDHGVGRVDFLKVDTDGYEVEVFSGAREVITRDAPLIFTEFGPTSLSRLHSAKFFFDLLVGLGCTRFLVFQHSGEFLGVATSLDQIMKFKADDYYVDLVCAPPGRFTAALERWT